MIGAGLHSKKITIQRPARTSDLEGGWVISYATVVNEQGTIRPASENETIIAKQRGADISHVAYFKGSSDVKCGDRLTAGDLVARVQAVRLPANATHHVEVDCLETQGE